MPRYGRVLHTRPYKDAIELQTLMMAQARSGDVRPADLAKLACAWETLENRKRILRGRPLPGSLRHNPVVKRRGVEQTADAWQEPDAQEVDAQELDALNVDPNAQPVADPQGEDEMDASDLDSTDASV